MLYLYIIMFTVDNSKKEDNSNYSRKTIQITQDLIEKLNRKRIEIWGSSRPIPSPYFNESNSKT